MKQDMDLKLEMPEGVSAKVLDQVNNTVEVTGPKGTIVKSMPSKRIDVKVDGNRLSIISKAATKRQKKLIFTLQSHLKNAFKGVTEGYEYQLKICSGHFPMTVGVKGDVLEIKNFIGEKVPRTVRIKKGVEVKIDGEIIKVTGVDKETTSTVASDIELLTRRPGFDHRIFQDGIYIISKDGKSL